MDEAVLDWGLNPGPSALEASIIPLGYGGGGTDCMRLVNQTSEHIHPFHSRNKVHVVAFIKCVWVDVKDTVP